MIYLASPYSDPDPAVRQARYEAACAAAAEMLKRGLTVFSPIAYTHPLSAHGLDGQLIEFWLRHDLPFLRQADNLIVLMLPGWQQSKGVAAEIAEARRLGIPVHYQDPPRPMVGQATQLPDNPTPPDSPQPE